MSSEAGERAPLGRLLELRAVADLLLEEGLSITAKSERLWRELALKLLRELGGPRTRTEAKDVDELEALLRTSKERDEALAERDLAREAANAFSAKAAEAVDLEATVRELRKLIAECEHDRELAHDEAETVKRLLEDAGGARSAVAIGLARRALFGLAAHPRECDPELFKAGRCPHCRAASALEGLERALDPPAACADVGAHAVDVDRKGAL